MSFPVTVRRYRDSDIQEMLDLWNVIIDSGNAFPQDEKLNLENGKEFFSSQSWCGVAEHSGKILGLYILHPNNVGRCGHICNASYAVNPDVRGMGIGEALVRDSLKIADQLGFAIMQFNAVLASNLPAYNLYVKLGFRELGSIPNGFRHNDGSFEAIRLFYYPLQKEKP